MVVEIERALPLMAAILIFRCTEGAGVGDYSSRGREALRLKVLRIYRDPGGSCYCAEATLFCDDVVSK